MDEPRTVVHLVHGTWPYGFLKRRSAQGEPEWFEEGSAFCHAIARLSVSPIEFLPFCWSGRNRASDRTIGGQKLRDRIRAIGTADPQVRQIVIAHSHGGNVVMAALDEHQTNWRELGLCAVICMATPFVSLTIAEREIRPLLPAALSTLLYAATLLVLASAKAPLLAFLGGASGVLLIVSPWLKRRLADNFPPELQPHLHVVPPSEPPLFIVRTTRDEAALAIGLAQSLQVLNTYVVRFFQNSDNISLRTAAALMVLSIVGLALQCTFFPGLLRLLLSLGPVSLGFTLVALDVMPFALLYVFAYVSLAFASGFPDPRVWRSSYHIEIEPVPQEQTCEFRCYVDADTVRAELGLPVYLPPGGNLTPSGLRHAIHSIAAVRRDISFLIADIQLGKRPTLVMGERIRQNDAWWKARKERTSDER